MIKENTQFPLNTVQEKLRYIIKTSKEKKTKIEMDINCDKGWIREKTDRYLKLFEDKRTYTIPIEHCLSVLGA